ncbi:MAG: DNA topoisomerase I, partial [Bacteroidetes bacterium]|nr:DNA topoisomerase I [Bacteroidota bacterium]
VGFELSPILWRKISSSATLSAGRVQSVSVRLVVEREREITAFKSESNYKVSAFFSVAADEPEGGKMKIIKAELAKRFTSHEEADEFLHKCVGANFEIKEVTVKPGKKSPSAPFTTSTLQQEASRKMGYSVSKTMMIAQKLYEAGKISYMRTDSVNLSETAIRGAASEIKSIYGDSYAETRHYKTKSAGAQEAHEAIRPTFFEQHSVEGSYDEANLYSLIWKRAIASQMSDAQIEKTTVSIGISTTEERLNATGEVMKFEGFLKVYLESVDEEEEDEMSTSVEGESEEGEELKEDATLPPMHVGQQLSLMELQAMERFSRPPSRYQEASLVRKLEELGIGRPSTYAPTISTIQKRGYVIKQGLDGVERKFNVMLLKNNEINTEVRTEITGAEKSKLFPTDIGSLVNDFLMQHFEKIMDYAFTANIEKEFDEIARGKKEWQSMIDAFYKPFHEHIEDTLKNVKRFSGERELGDDPKTGKPIFAKMGRYGPMVQMGLTDDEEKPKFAKLLPQQKLETITFEEALELFKLPRLVTTYEGEDVTATIGRFGPYLRHKDKFYSLGKDGDAFKVQAEEAIIVIEEKRKKDAEKTIKTFVDEGDEEIMILNGRYGPYVALGRQYAAVPKDRDPKDLTLEECKTLLEEAKEKKGKRKTKSKTKKKS